MLIKISKYLIYSHFLIAFAAALQICLSYLLLGYDVNSSMAVFQGACTIVFYNLSFWASKPRYPEESIYERTRWFWHHRKWMQFISAIAFIVLLLIIKTLRLELCVYIFSIGIFSIGYMVPIIPWNGKRLSLRDVPGLKLFVICTIWTISVVGLPYLDLTLLGHPIDLGQIFYVGLSNFLFLIICTLPFDIRDAKQDAIYQLKTIPTMIGIKRAKIICFVLLTLHFLMVVIGNLPLAIQLSMLTTDILVLAIYLYLFREKSNYIHTYILDAMLVVQSILVWGVVVFGKAWFG